MENVLLKAALEYAARGLYILPLTPGGKRPLIKGWREASATDSAVIRNWWKQYPRANIGIDTGKSRLVILDFDAAGGKSGLQIYKKYHAAGTLPDTWRARSARGGIHEYYRGATGNRAGLYGCVDVRSSGGLIVAPPSVFTGKRYRWEVSPGEVELAEAPAELWEFINGAPENKKRSEPFKAPETIPQGSRTAALVSMIGSLSAKGLSAEAIRTAVIIENESKCNPPLTEKELAREVFPALSHNWESGAPYYPSREFDDSEFDENGFPVELSKYHRFTGVRNPRPSDILDDSIAEDVIKSHELFVLEGKVYLYAGGVYLMDEDGARTMEIIRHFIYPELRQYPRLQRVYKLILARPELRVDLADINAHPGTLVNFRNGMLDVLKLELLPHEPKYRSINQIPHEWAPERAQGGLTASIVRRYLEEWVPDPDDREMLMQYAGYCMTVSTALQSFLIITGDGGLGKSVFLGLLEYAIGKGNCSALSLQMLSDPRQRFQTAVVLGKTANICGDISSSALQDSSTVKLLTGGDSMQAEYKGGKSFTFIPYAKLVFSANRIPMVSEDKTGAFYRRLLILRIWRRCHDIPRLEERLRADVGTFIYLAITALRRVYITGEGKQAPAPAILRSGNCQREVLDVYMTADSVKAFLYYRTIQKHGGRVERGLLYEKYTEYCDVENRLSLSKQAFFNNLREKGKRDLKSGDRRYFDGLQLAPDDYEPDTPATYEELVAGGTSDPLLN